MSKITGQEYQLIHFPVDLFIQGSALVEIHIFLKVKQVSYIYVIHLPCLIIGERGGGVKLQFSGMTFPISAN